MHMANDMNSALLQLKSALDSRRYTAPEIITENDVRVTLAIKELVHQWNLTLDPSGKVQRFVLVSAWFSPGPSPGPSEPSSSPLHCSEQLSSSPGASPSIPSQPGGGTIESGSR